MTNHKLLIINHNHRGTNMDKRVVIHPSINPTRQHDLFEDDDTGTWPEYLRILEKRSKLDALVYRIQSPIMHQSIQIENSLGDILASHFFEDNKKRNQFYILISCYQIFSFITKIKIFENIMNISYPDIIKKHPKLFNYLYDLHNIRNKIAHWTIDTDITPYIVEEIIGSKEIIISTFKMGKNEKR